MSDAIEQQSESLPVESASEPEIKSMKDLHEQIAKDHEAKRQSAKASAPVEKVVENPNAGVESAQSVGESSSIWDEAAKEFEPKPDPQEEGLEPEVKKSSGYQKLKAEKQQLAEQLATFQAQLEEIKRQPPAPPVQQGPSPELLALQQQNQMLMQMFQQATQPAPAPVDPNDPLNLVYQGLAPKFAQEHLSPLEQRLAAMEARDQEREAYIQGLQQQQAEAQRRAEKEQLSASYKQQAQAALEQTFYSTSDMTDETSKTVLERTAILLALANKTSPEEATRQLKQAMVHWAQGFERKKNSPAIAKAQASGSVPRPAPEATTRAHGGDPTPDIKDIQANGFKNYMEWMMAGSPTLKARK